MNAPICPHCKNEISFLVGLKISNPFYFKCPLCKMIVKQFTMLLFVLCVFLAFCATGFGFWIAFKVLSGDLIGTLQSLPVLIIFSLLAEIILFWVLSKHGILKNNKN